MIQNQTLCTSCFLLVTLMLTLYGCTSESEKKQTTPSPSIEATEQLTTEENSYEEDPEIDEYPDADFQSDIDFPEFENPNCPNWQPGQTIEISESQTLPENCSFQRVTLQFTKPDLIFNCNGAVFNGLETKLRTPFDTSYVEEAKPHHFGFLFSTHESNADQLSNITVQNCQLINYVNSIFIVMALSPETKASLRKGQYDEQSLRDLAPTSISVKDSRLINSHHHGIFVHRYVTDFELVNTTIKGSGNSGLYLEAGSRYSVIKNSIFEGNGFSTYSTTTGLRGPRKSQNSRREGIAIDGSQYNTIRDNQFIANADGGLYLYKNCWEDAANPATIPRSEGANNNLIENNFFKSEHVGIWLAERADRNLSNFSCGDPVIHVIDEEMYYRDYASNNKLSKNTFDSVITGIRIHDSNNSITENTFINTLSGTDIEIGSKIREFILDPVINITLENNRTGNSSSVLDH